MNLFPNEEYRSTYEIPFPSFYKEGYRGVIFDIDNTLVPHGFPADEKAIQLFLELKRLGFATCLVSNNKKERVASFAEEVGADYIFKAGKPSRKGYLQAAKTMGVSKDQVLCVGDQIFTDTWGARRAGMYTLLVKKIDSKEEIQIVLKRVLEAVVLFFYHLTKGAKYHALRKTN